MHRQKLTLYSMETGNLRTVIKTKHGRIIYWELIPSNGKLIVKDCYYLDRMRSGKCYAAPKKLVTKEFSSNDIINVIESELDRRYYGIEFSDDYRDLSSDKFIDIQLRSMQRKYNFLIFIGEGEPIDGIPSIIRTRFKNRIHRGIYLELNYSGNGKGVVTDCRYYDRKYKERSTVIPETLSTVFFDYNRQAILHIVNSELNNSFTHIIFIHNKDSGINIEDNIALCGNI